MAVLMGNRNDKKKLLLKTNHLKTTSRRLRSLKGTFLITAKLLPMSRKVIRIFQITKKLAVTQKSRKSKAK